MFHRVYTLLAHLSLPFLVDSFVLSSLYPNVEHGLIVKTSPKTWHDYDQPRQTSTLLTLRANNWGT